MNRHQRIFCLACLHNNKHSHDIVTLPDFLEDAIIRTEIIKEGVDKIHHQSVARYEKIKHLVEYLEQKNQGLVVADYKHISRDMDHVERLKAESDELANTIDDAFVKKDVTKFIETHRKIERLKDHQPNLEYLQRLSEEMLFNNYMSTWSTNLDMSNLSQDDKLTIINFKLRYLTSLY